MCDRSRLPQTIDELRALLDHGSREDLAALASAMLDRIRELETQLAQARVCKCPRDEP